MTEREMMDFLENYNPMDYTFKLCPECKWIFVTDENGKYYCPACEQEPEKFGIFPSIPNIRFQEMIAYYMRSYVKRKDSIINSQRSTVESQIEKLISVQHYKRIGDEIREIFEKHGEDDLAYDAILNLIVDELDISEEKAKRIMPKLLGIDEDIEEVKVITILICTYLETSFNDLILFLNQDRSLTINSIEKLNITDKYRLFSRLTGVKFNKYLSDHGFNNYSKYWASVRKSRNRFIHESPYAINRDIFMKSLSLLKDSNTLYAKIRNEFLPEIHVTEKVE